jgi:hypothetical protein
MNRRQTAAAAAITAVLGLSSLTACGSSPSANAETVPGSTSGNIHEHEAHQWVDEGTAVSHTPVNPREHLAHLGH